ncbi:MAG: hypothetical protein STSR0004_06460 [Peptococcaceae bacterium]
MTNISMADSRIFIDSSGFIGLTSKKDQYHDIVKSFFCEIVNKRVFQITTNLILSETYTYLRYHENYHTACFFLEKIRKATKENFLFIVYSNALLEEKAFEILKKYKDQDLSFTDAVSFACLEMDQETKDVLTLDNHFYLTGRNILPLKALKE